MAPDICEFYILERAEMCQLEGRVTAFLQVLNESYNFQLFDRLRNEKPSAFNKIKVVQGDVLFEDFGLSTLEIDNLAKEITVVFHFAATLRLEAPLRDNVNMNTSGTLRTIKVAKRFTKLAIFIHLSTAFCYPDYVVLDEKVILST